MQKRFSSGLFTNQVFKDRALKEFKGAEAICERFIDDLKKLSAELHTPAFPGGLKERKSALKNVPSALRKAAAMIDRIDYETWAFATCYSGTDAEGFESWTEASNDIKAFTEPAKIKEAERLRALADRLEAAYEVMQPSRAPEIREIIAASLASLFKQYSLPFNATKSSFAAECFITIANSSCVKGLRKTDDPSHWLSKEAGL